MKNIILLVLGGVIVVCCLGLGILFWKKRREDLRQQEKEKIFQEKYGVEPPEFGTLTWIDQKVYPFSYDLNLRYEEKESGLYIWKPSVQSNIFSICTTKEYLLLKKENRLIRCLRWKSSKTFFQTRYFPRFIKIKKSQKSGFSSGFLILSTFWTALRVPRRSSRTRWRSWFCRCPLPAAFSFV